MSWEKATLGDVADIFSGYAFKSADMNPEEGTPLIKIKNIADSAVSHQCDAFLNKDFDLSKYERFHLLRDDFLVAMTGQGSVGRIGKMRSYRPGYYVNQRVAIVRVNPQKANPVFVYYQIATSSNELELFNKANGAGQPNISAKQIGELPILLPPNTAQQYIADTLSAYDDLIENNQKQIKLLEEAAQRLYKEWFVDLRFPGHETTPITDGIPEGWAEGTLADLAVFKRGKTITKGQVNEGNIPVVAGGLEPAYYHDTSNTDVPVITVSGSGANAGFTRMYYTNVWASDCSYVDSSVTQDITWVYCFLKENKASIDSMQKGAAQPHVYAKDINAMKTVVPCDSIMEQFRTMADSIFARIGKLEGQIKILAEARDRLLPKLMNGEIEV